MKEEEEEAKGSQVRFEVALGDWVATGVWVERLVWGNVSASRKETPPPPLVLCKRGEVAACSCETYIRLCATPIRGVPF